jgi:hypothetical protein
VLPTGSSPEQPADERPVAPQGVAEHPVAEPPVAPEPAAAPSVAPPAPVDPPPQAQPVQPVKGSALFARPTAVPTDGRHRPVPLAGAGDPSLESDQPARREDDDGVRRLFRRRPRP